MSESILGGDLPRPSKLPSGSSTTTAAGPTTAAGAAGPTTATTAGGVMRQAREAKGLHIAALAASIKVTPGKLEALEADQFDRLPDATFTRALAQAVCRSLKIDPVPVLALLPPPNGHRLEEVAEGLKTPFNERPGRLVPGQWLKLSGATVWIAALLVLAALALYVMPAGWVAVPRSQPLPAASSPSSFNSSGSESTLPATDNPAPELSSAGGPQAAAVANESVPVVTAGSSASAPVTTALAAAAGVAPAAPLAASAAGGGVLRFTTTAPSWIGVTDADGKSLIGRLVQPGETVDVDGPTPLTLRLGHASTVRLKFRGEAVDLRKYVRDDVARFQLK